MRILIAGGHFRDPAMVLSMSQKAYLKMGEDLFSDLNKPLEEITEEELRNFLELKSWLAPDSQKQQITIVKSLFKFARRKRMILIDPAEDLTTIQTHDKINERLRIHHSCFACSMA